MPWSPVPTHRESCRSRNRAVTTSELPSRPGARNGSHRPFENRRSPPPGPGTAAPIHRVVAAGGLDAGDAELTDVRLQACEWIGRRRMPVPPDEGGVCADPEVVLHADDEDCSRATAGCRSTVRNTAPARPLRTRGSVTITPCEQTTTTPWRSSTRIQDPVGQFWITRQRSLVQMLRVRALCLSTSCRRVRPAGR